MNAAADWLNRNLEINNRGPLSPDQERCAEVLWSMTKIYNIPTPCSTTDAIDIEYPTSLSILTLGELATFDGSELFRLVTEAHRHHVRVAIRAWRYYGDDSPRRSKAIWEHMTEDDDEPDPFREYDEKQAALEVELVYAPPSDQNSTAAPHFAQMSEE